jgi:hypothetical protein
MAGSVGQGSSTLSLAASSPAGVAQGVPGVLDVEALALAARVSGGNVTVSFLTATGFSYQVEYRNHMTDATWTPLGSPVSDNGSSQSVKDPVAGSSRFYRVQIQ